MAMQSMRRSFALLMVFVIVLGGLTGCDQETPVEVEEEATPDDFPIERVDQIESVQENSALSDTLRSATEQVLASNSKLNRSAIKKIKLQLKEGRGAISLLVAPLESKGGDIEIKRNGNAVSAEVESARVAYVLETGNTYIEEVAYHNDEKYSRFSSSSRSGSVIASSGNVVKIVDGSPYMAMTCDGTPNTALCEGTASCYQAAQEACSSDGGCSAVRDTLNLVGGISDLAILTACAAFNNL